jgi:hypothetical protein
LDVLYIISTEIIEIRYASYLNVDEDAPNRWSLAISATEAGLILSAGVGVEVGGVEMGEAAEAHQVAESPGFTVVAVPDPDDGMLWPGVDRGEIPGVTLNQRASQFRPGARVATRGPADRAPEAVQAHTLVSEDLQLLSQGGARDPVDFPCHRERPPANGMTAPTGRPFANMLIMLIGSIKNSFAIFFRHPATSLDR